MQPDTRLDADAGPAPAIRVNPPRRRATRALVLVCIAAAAVLVAGAAAIGPGRTDESLLRGFQIRVLALSQAAAENRMDGALAALQALEKDLGDAAANGRLSTERYQGIESALASVRADLAAQVAAAAPPDTTADGSAEAVPSGALADPAAVPAEPAVAAVVPDAPAAADTPGPGRANAAKDAKGKPKGAGKP